jgi:signal transduction histidine kinase
LPQPFVDAAVGFEIQSHPPEIGLGRLVKPVHWACSADGRLLDVDADWRDYAGFDGGATPDWERLIHPGDLEACAATWRSPVIAEEVREVEARLRRSDGHHDWHLLRGVGPSEPSGNWHGWCTNIASQKAREADLVVANRHQDEFLGIISHELRGLLLIVAGNARLLLDPPATLERSDEIAALSDIERETTRMLERFDQLLALSRPPGPGGIETEPTLVQHIVRRTVARHASRFPSRPVVTSIAGRPGPARGVGAFIEEIVENLLANAENYSDPLAPISVETAEVGTRIIVRVLDQGPGMSDEELERVFDPFQRLRHSTVIAGAGLGLTVCRKLAEAQGGRVRAEHRDGGGTAFVLELPLWHGDEGEEVG